MVSTKFGKDLQSEAIGHRESVQDLALLSKRSQTQVSRPYKS